MPGHPSADLARLIACARDGEAALAPAIRPGALEDPVNHAIARLVDALDETAAAGPHLPPDDPTIPGLAAAETEYALGLLTLLVEAVGVADRAVDRAQDRPEDRAEDRAARETETGPTKAGNARPVPDRARLTALASSVAAVAHRCLDRVDEADLAADYRASLDHAERRLRRLAQGGPAARMR